MRLLLTAAATLLATLSTSAQWSEEAKLVPGDLLPGDALGLEVAVSGDTAVVGAPYHDGVAADAGAVYVYVRAGVGWIQQAKLRALDGGSGDLFGASVSLDGDTALIGAPYHADPKGATYVFVRSGSTWSQQAKLELATSDPGWMGGRVSLDGDTAAVTAQSWSGMQGNVYIYVRSGSNWSLQKHIGCCGWYDGFGCSLDLDGDYLVVGVNLYDDVFVDNVGAAFVYKRGGANWGLRTKLWGPIVENYRFGSQVAISADTILVAAAPEK